MEFDLARTFNALSGEFTVEDKSASNFTAQVEIYGDGRLLLDKEVAFGTTTPWSIDIQNTLRLQIRVTAQGGQGSVIFGNPL